VLRILPFIDHSLIANIKNKSYGSKFKIEKEGGDKGERWRGEFMYGTFDTWQEPV
jgi:hypothetical protein